MKSIKYSVSLLLVGLVMVFGSCSDSFFDINDDPNAPGDVQPARVLPPALVSSAFTMGGYYQALGGFWSQQYAQAPAASQWATWESYNLTEEDFSRQYQLLYSGALADYENIRTKTKETESWAYYAIATLMQAYTFEVLADLYDEIPFLEALQGAANLQPKFDDGQSVYEALITRIDEVLALDFSSSTVVAPEVDDLVFNGDMEQWIQFGNTLKLKMMLRFVNADPSKYTNEIATLLTENNFLGADAKVTAYRPDQTGYNPYYNTFVDNLSGNIVANSTLISFLDNNMDPRKEKIFLASETGASYTGVATGTSRDLAGNTSRNYATPAITNTYPVYFFSQEEVLFLVAEAQQRYGSATDAETAFNDAIAASLTSLGLPADTVSYTYNGIQSIIEQKWIAATNKRSLESFFDFCRTGYPDFFSVSPTSVLTGGVKPKRLFYPQDERNRNPNTPERVALTEPVWWGK